MDGPSAYTLLARLADIKKSQQLAISKIAELKDGLITDEQRLAMSEIDAEWEALLEVHRNQIGELDPQVRQAVLAVQRTVSIPGAVAAFNVRSFIPAETLSYLCSKYEEVAEAVRHTQYVTITIDNKETV